MNLDHWLSELAALPQRECENIDGPFDPPNADALKRAEDVIRWAHPLLSIDEVDFDLKGGVAIYVVDAEWDHDSEPNRDAWIGVMNSGADAMELGSFCPTSAPSVEEQCVIGERRVVEHPFDKAKLLAFFGVTLAPPASPSVGGRVLPRVDPSVVVIDDDGEAS